MSKRHVLIIGAGAAGLRAAQLLVAAGREVTILEARERLGGRIHTLDGVGRPPIEAGPEFVHGESAEMQRLLDAASVQTVELPDQHWRMIDGRPEPVPFDKLWGRIGERLEQFAGPDLAFTDFLAAQFTDLSPDERTTALDYVEGFNAADSRRVSTAWLRETEAAVGSDSESAVRRVTGGYARLVAAVAADLPASKIHLRTRVDKIRWRPGRVDVDAVEDGRPQTFSADAAIVTLPLGVWQAETVEFIPALPEKLAAARQMQMGAVVKVVFRFHCSPLPAAGLDRQGFLHLPGAKFLAWWPLGDSPLLTGWSGGPRAEALSQLDDEAILAAAVEELTHALRIDPIEFRRHIAESRVFNWQRDRDCRGAYAYPTAGGVDAPHRLAATVAQTLFFAGEATEREFMGTVTGALLSGRRAAEQLLAES